MKTPCTHALVCVFIYCLCTCTHKKNSFSDEQNISGSSKRLKGRKKSSKLDMEIFQLNVYYRYYFDSVTSQFNYNYKVYPAFKKLLLKVFCVYYFMLVNSLKIKDA